jgi:hypothetical protein
MNADETFDLEPDPNREGRISLEQEPERHESDRFETLIGSSSAFICVHQR